MLKKAKFLLASTSETYGDPLIHPQSEDYWGNVNAIGPRGCYDESKRFAEALVMVEGAEALTIKTNYPQYTTISFDRSAGSGGGYFISSQQQSGRKTSEFIKLNEKNKTGLYILRAVDGPAEDPTSLTIELVATGEKVKISKTEPYQKIDGYLVDLRYEPEQKNFLKQKINDTLTFSGETYKVVYITNNEVRVQSNQTSKQTTITW